MAHERDVNEAPSHVPLFGGYERVWPGQFMFSSHEDASWRQAARVSFLELKMRP